MGDTSCWSRKSGRNPTPEEEEATGTMCGDLTSIPIPCLPSPLGRDKVENLSSNRREGSREGVLRYSFISHYPILIRLVIN